ncbi:hypothetical protein, partial [Asticcacaulis biprosthecium]|uniref:hypothetical protein n=1 Tax=Asticcacaulis biprosthecium TaxID=76891 RepID=UPI001B7FA9A7
MIHLDLFRLCLARPSPHRPLDPTSKRGFDLSAEPVAAGYATALEVFKYFGDALLNVKLGVGLPPSPLPS